jgi:hypothetical protein
VRYADLVRHQSFGLARAAKIRWLEDLVRAG